jgi:alkanesulfonate monooxygenase SsuD/methylene tetrahydromethanopterin reductase-like flavin-dependent oxidoreductase (luciferase family)
MLGINVFAADSDEEAQLLATSMQQAFINLRTGKPTTLQPPVAGYLDQLSPPERYMLDSVLSCSAIGSAATVESAMQAFASRTGADEIIVASMIYDPHARMRSYEIAAEVWHKQ